MAGEEMLGVVFLVFVLAMNLPLCVGESKKRARHSSWMLDDGPWGDVGRGGAWTPCCGGAKQRPVITGFVVDDSQV